MQALSTREEILVTEQVILRSLCQQPFAPAQRKEILRILAGYTWQSGEHRILFEALHQSQIASAERLREQLPAILTRKGFPDVDFAGYFAAAATTAAQALCVARALVAGTHGEQ
jgi:hypothetical protein